LFKCQDINIFCSSFSLFSFSLAPELLQRKTLWPHRFDPRKKNRISPGRPMVTRQLRSDRKHESSSKHPLFAFCTVLWIREHRSRECSEFRETPPVRLPKPENAEARNAGPLQISLLRAQDQVLFRVEDPRSDPDIIEGSEAGKDRVQLDQDEYDRNSSPPRCEKSFPLNIYSFNFSFFSPPRNKTKQYKKKNSFFEPFQTPATNCLINIQLAEFTIPDPSALPSDVNYDHANAFLFHV